MTLEPDMADEPAQAPEPPIDPDPSTSPEPSNPEPPSPRTGTPVATIALGVVVIVSLALVVAGYLLGRSQGAHAERTKIEKQLAAIVGTPGGTNPDLLQHAKAETFIEARYEVTGVVCNKGDDMTILVGASYLCSAPGAKSYRVTITDLAGDFEVRPVS
jgi:hypothetical protein